MAHGSSTLLACLCGGWPRNQGPLEETLEILPSPCPPASSKPDVVLDNGHGVQCKTTEEANEFPTLLQLQRELGAHQGTWLSRARAVLESIAAYVGGAQIRFFGITPSYKDGQAASFVLLASVEGPAGSKGDARGLLLPGQEVWPASAMDGMQDMFSQSYNRSGSRNLPPLDSLPVLLDRMLAAQAPVFYSASTSTPSCAMRAAGRTSEDDARSATATVNGIGGTATADFPNATVALVPLTAGGAVSGALWLARYDPGSQHACSGNRPAFATTSNTTTATCLGPPLLTSERALLQLGLSVSMCLLGTDLPYVMTLAEGLHHLAAASSVQQLVGGLCDTVTQHVRQRFLLEPRVVAALVPKPASTVGLLFSWGAGPDRGGGPGSSGVVGMGAVGATSSRAQQLKTGSRTPPLALAYFSSEGRRGERLLDGSRGYAGTGTGYVGRVGSSRVAGRVAVLMGKEGGGAHLAERPLSDSVTRSLKRNPHQQQQGGAVGGTGSGGGGGGGVLMDREGSSSMTPRSMRAFAAQRVVALTQSGEAGGDVGAERSLLASHHSGAGPTALRVKPFPLAQTLLRQLMRRVAATAADGDEAAATVRAGDGSAMLAGSGGGPYFARVLSVEVEDCALHMQDPKKPSRDILLLLANAGSMGGPLLARDGPSSAAVPSDRLANSASGLGNGPAGCLRGSGGLLTGGNSGSFTSGRRALCSLLLLTLPTGDGKGLLGLYVTFPQQLPQQLLREASASLREVLEVATPLVTRKLLHELPLELETLATAAPGSYAVVEGTEGDDCATATTTVTANVLVGCDLRRFEGKLVIPEDNAIEAHARLETLYSQITPSFLCDSRGGGLGTGDGGVMMRSVNLMDTAPSPHVLGEHTPAVMDGRSTSTSIIHVEDLDAVSNTLRAQMPLLVASMQNSISNARAEAAVAAAAAAAAASFNRSASTSSTSLAPRLAAGQGDIAQLELHSQLGHGGCAVVFKGTLGTLDCAIKVMEMPDVDGVDDTDTLGKLHLKATAAAKDPAGGGGGKEADKEACGGGGAGVSGAKQLAARRALLRNAMELAAMTSISYPNIMQVYSTFSNVTLGRRSMPDGSQRLFLRPVDSIADDPDDPPVCVAIVCEWCDKGCLATALVKRTFPALLASPNQNSPPSAQTSGSSGGARAKATKAFDYKGILMTLLDVAMALRHLHAHNLVHRDLKPANVLLKTNTMDPRGFTAKLADFGFVTLLNQPGDEKSGGEPFAFVEETCGTVTHMAPESLTKAARLDASCDVYSFGILMWEMTSGGVRPYPEVHPSNIARVVQRGVRPIFDESVPAQYRLLAQRCWAGNSLNRPRSPELVATISQLLGCL